MADPINLASIKSHREASYTLDDDTYNKYSGLGGLLNREDIASNMIEVLGSENRAETFNTDYFNRYRHIYPGDEIKSGKKYCFIVKPDLNVLGAVEKDPYFADIYMNRPYLLQALTHPNITENAGITESNHFISFLSDRALTFALPDLQVEEYKIDQPYTGFSTSFAGNSNRYRTDQSTQVQFRDTVNLDIMTLFDAWIKYIDLVSYGVVSPYYDYATGKLTYGTPIIDYATSIYEIITKPDGMTIIYWAKITGAFPTTIPHSNYQFSSTDEIDNDIEIQFSGGLPEFLNPRILADFNYNAGLFEEGEYGEAIGVNRSILSGTNGTTRINLGFVPNARFGYENMSTPGGSSIVGAPYITYDATHKQYYLRWRPRPES
jgi:hypothetical protein